MRKMTTKEFGLKMKQIQERNKQIEMRNKLRDERNKLRKKSKSKMETHKFLAYYLFILFNAILIYALVVMWHFADLSYLGVIITDILAQILVYIVYCLKAYKGKKQEEQMKFEKEKLFGSFNDGEDVSIELDDSEVVC